MESRRGLGIKRKRAAAGRADSAQFFQNKNDSVGTGSEGFVGLVGIDHHVNRVKVGGVHAVAGQNACCQRSFGARQSGRWRCGRGAG